MNLIAVLVLIAGCALLPVAISMVVEALRRPPETPRSLYWDSGIPIQYATVGGMRIRYIRLGRGPDLVLLHTLRTQLDIFQKLVPRLAADFTVWCLDYPGHGFSDIPQVEYRPELFVRTVEGFLDEMDIKEATLAGISIGATVALLIAANQNPRVKRIVPINSYDYGKGLGVGRGNLVAWLVFTLARFPVLGETVMRFRNRMVERLIMEGGVADPQALSREFLEQLFDSGLRKGHYRAFLNLVRNAHRWEDARQVYGRIGVPALVIYGDRDWSHLDERQRTAQAIPGARVETVANGGHFLSLDQPGRLVELIRRFATS